MKLIFLAVVLAWPATALADVPALCADAPNQIEGTACATHKLANANGALSRAYDALASKLDPLGRHNLDRAQSAWLTYRDSEPARRKQIMKLGDDLAAQVSAKKLSNAAAAKRLGDGLPTGAPT